MTTIATHFFHGPRHSSLLRSSLLGNQLRSTKLGPVRSFGQALRRLSTRTTFLTGISGHNKGSNNEQTTRNGTRLILDVRLGMSTVRSYSTDDTPPPARRENIYTIPNLLTVSRILACPILGWSIVQGDFGLATGILAYAGVTDLLDGYIARRYNSGTVLGSILDPAADKTLMTTLVISLAYKGMLPIPLAIIILGRDVLLSISAFYYRWISLPPPKTMKRYWDFSIPSAEVRPTQISKYNTFLQLILMGSTTISPLLGFDASLFLTSLQWVVGGTTVWSGLSYVFSKDAVRILSNSATKHKK